MQRRVDFETLQLRPQQSIPQCQILEMPPVHAEVPYKKKLAQGATGRRAGQDDVRGEMTRFGVGDCDLIGLVGKDVRADDLRRRRTPVDRRLQISAFSRRGPSGSRRSAFARRDRPWRFLPQSGGVSALAASSTQKLWVWWEYFVRMARAPVGPGACRIQSVCSDLVECVCDESHRTATSPARGPHGSPRLKPAAPRHDG